VNSSQEQRPTPNAELTAATEIFAEGWRRTKAIFALKGMEIPDTIEFLIEGRWQIRATRVATLEELSRGVAALGDAIEHPSEHKASAMSPYFHLDIEQLHRDRDALVELQERASQGRAPALTTVIEALFPDVPTKKKTAATKAEIERWLAIRKEEALKIDPDTAEVDWSYALTLDPYGVLDEWELPQEFHQVGREYFARAPGSDVWVEFGDLPRETRDKLWHKHRHMLAFPAGLEDLPLGFDRGNSAR
jgi:hypothetical protein